MWRSLAGSLDAMLISADISGALNSITNAGITLIDTKILDDLTVIITFKRSDFQCIRQLCLRRGEQLKLQRWHGIYWTIKGLLKRPLLIFGMALFAFLSIYLPTKVLFVRIEGNEVIPSRKILEVSTKCGIYFGSSRQDVRSERVKNALLEAMPELQWVGVNTKGCVAVISVRERAVTNSDGKDEGVSSIVASRDGVIANITVTKGSASCKIGQAIKKGDLLISGYSDCGLCIRAEHADGEIFAHTQREITQITPCEWSYRNDENDISVKYGLIIGKKRINFCKGSGISDGSCVKMYEENYITLPGGFVLPIAFTKETYIRSDLSNGQISAESASLLLTESAKAYLHQQMIAGEILTQEEYITQNGGIYQMDGHYACSEMIGVQRDEEIIKPYGKSNGKAG